MAGTVLCRLDDIPVPGSKGFMLGEGREVRDVFVVRDAAGIYAYDNSCPHTGGPLDWVEDQFLTLDRRRILCATHGAEFRMTDGHCLRGPCAGDALTPLAIAVEDGAVILLEIMPASP